MNKTITSAALSLCVGLACLPAIAQDAAPTQAPRTALWSASFGDTTKLTINVSSIVSVSMHPYLLNGQIPITEVTVDTQGNNTIRFYYIHEEDPSAAAGGLKEAAGSARRRLQQEMTQQKDGSQIPSIKFPEGAYAHTVEYQMNSLSDLTKLYQSLVSVWERSSQKLTTFKTESK